MSELKESVAAVIPVYNPEPGLSELCRRLSETFALVVVVDDGSTEDRGTFAALEGVRLLSHPVNRGKGAAIKTALAYLSGDRPDIRVAVFVDGDGQHRVEDAAAVAGAALAENCVAIGERSFGAGVPFRSRFGNFWTSFWTWVFLGIRLGDTQTGLRAIPARLFPELLGFSEDGFAYEMRLWGLLVRHGERPRELPIKTIYIESNRTSHYDPWRDTCRVYRVLFSDSFRRFSGRTDPSVGRRKFGSVLISGASSGIGAALACECVRRGATRLFLCGRDAGRLEAVAARCRELSACAVYPSVVDVTDEKATREWIERSAAVAPLELVFANAGVATGAETEENIRRTFATNVGGVLNVALPAIAVFRNHAEAARDPSASRNPRAALVLTASIAGYAPLSGCPSYSGTKACVKTWGLAMRGMLKKEGIGVNVLCPGFVRSRITDANTCPMPFFMEADKAARVIMDRVERDVGLIAFPWPMRFAVWSLSCLPARLSEFVASLLPAKVRRQGVVTDGPAKS